MIYLVYLLHPIFVLCPVIIVLTGQNNILFAILINILIIISSLVSQFYGLVKCNKWDIIKNPNKAVVVAWANELIFVFSIMLFYYIIKTLKKMVEHQQLTTYIMCGKQKAHEHT